MIDNNYLLGKVLGGKYRLVEPIGEGSYAVVFRAWQKELARYVAVKVLLPRVDMDEGTYQDFLARFKREAGIIAQFQHDHIVSIFDFGEQDEQAYIVMPYLPGGSLQDILTRRGKLSLSEALSYVEQAASALDYAHARHVIHRDLKPSNFLLRETGHLVLADFGIARILQQHPVLNPMTLTKTDVFLGTPAYVAPEMIQGHAIQPIDHHVDIYEFGVVLFQMLSGDIPFRGSDYWTILRKHIEEPLPLLSQMNPTIPPTVDAVVQKATAKRPGDRFASAGEFARALRTALTLSSPIAVDPRYAATILPTESVAQRLAHNPSPSSYSTTTPVAPTLQDMGSTPLPHTVDHPVKQLAPPHLKPLLLLMLLAVLITVLFTGILRASHAGSSQPIPTPVPTLPPVLTQSVAIIQQYYNDLSQRNYMDAYTLRTDVADYCSFTNSYAATVSDRIQVDRAILEDNGTSRIEITIYATEVRSSGEVIMHTYRIYHIVQNGKIIGGGNIGSGPSGLIGTATVIAEPITAATPSQQARDIVQEFYDNINQRNYPAAYNLLGKSFQSTMPYCQFVAGYAGTKHDQIVFDTVAPLPDGTVDVEVTIDAEASTGGHSSYQWNGIVGQEDGYWKILKATQQQVS